MTLYEINAQIQDLYDRAVDPETGEIDEDALTALEALNVSWDDKVENTALYIKNMKSDAKQIREEIKALTERARVLENKAERVEKYLKDELHGAKFSSPRVAISYRTSNAVVCDDISLLPPQYLRTKDPEADKESIKKDLKAGKEIPGAYLEERVSMLIK